MAGMWTRNERTSLEEDLQIMKKQWNMTMSAKTGNLSNWCNPFPGYQLLRPFKSNQPSQMLFNFDQLGIEGFVVNDTQAPLQTKEIRISRSGAWPLVLYYTAHLKLFCVCGLPGDLSKTQILTECVWVYLRLLIPWSQQCWSKGYTLNSECSKLPGWF